MITLFHAPRSPFAFKTRILVHELGLVDRISFVDIDPWTNEDLRLHNPLCKVPVLVLRNGESLFDSRVICEYLDGIGERSVIPPGLERWAALRHQALADGLAEAVIRRFIARLGPASKETGREARRHELAIVAALDELERLVRPERDPTIGDIAAAAALTYLGFRSPELPWRESRDSLSAWFANFASRPSMRAANFVLPIRL